MKNKKIIGFVSISLAAFVYGVGFISREILLKIMHPSILIILQFTMMTVIYGAFCLITKKNINIKKKDFFGLFLSGILGINMYNYFINIGIRETGASVTSILIASIPVFCLIAEVLFYSRKITKLSIISMIVSLIGVWAVVGSGESAFHWSSIKGYGAILVGIISWVTFCFLCSNYYDTYEMPIILTIQGAGGVISSIPFLFIYKIPWESFNTNFIIHLLIAGLLNATLGYILYIIAIKNIGITMTNLFNNFIPVVTIVISLIFFDKMVSFSQCIGCLFIILSVVLLNKESKTELEADTSIKQTA